MSDFDISTANRRILVVDDDSAIADLVSEALHRDGYTNVCIAGTGLEAVRICRDQQPDLIVPSLPDKRKKRRPSGHHFLLKVRGFPRASKD